MVTRNRKCLSAAGLHSEPQYQRTEASAPYRITWRNEVAEFVSQLSAFVLFSHDRSTCQAAPRTRVLVEGSGANSGVVSRTRRSLDGLPSETSRISVG